MKIYEEIPFLHIFKNENVDVFCDGSLMWRNKLWYLVGGIINGAIFFKGNTLIVIKI